MAPHHRPTVDETYELLSHSRGRLVLQYFDQHANPVKLEDIAPTVARWEAPDGTNPSDREVRRVREALHDDFFPWFEDLGLGTYDADGRMVRYDGEVISNALANAETALEFFWSADGHGEAGLDGEFGVAGDGRSIGGE